MEINRLRQEECPVCLLEFDINMKQPVAGKKYNNDYCNRHIICLQCIKTWTSTRPNPRAHHLLDIPCPVCKDRLIGCIPIFPGMTYVVGFNLETNNLEMLEDLRTGGYIREVGDDVLNPVQLLALVRPCANDDNNDMIAEDAADAEDEQRDQPQDENSDNVPGLNNMGDAEQGGGGGIEAEVGGDGGEGPDNGDERSHGERRVGGDAGPRFQRVEGAGGPGGGHRRRRNPQENFGEFNQLLNKFICRRCGKPLSTRKILRRHWGQVHVINTRKFHCEQCTSYFTRNESLVRHVRKNHP